MGIPKQSLGYSEPFNDISEDQFPSKVMNVVERLQSKFKRKVSYKKVGTKEHCFRIHIMVCGDLTPMAAIGTSPQKAIDRLNAILQFAG